jgi:hypothetical protein
MKEGILWVRLVGAENSVGGTMMEEELLRLAALERVATASRVVCRNPRSPSAQRELGYALDDLDGFEGDDAEPVTQVGTQPPMIQVRAAVAVAPGGRFSVHGSSEEQDEDVIRNHVYARLCHVENCTVHFIEAFVPLASPVIVGAHVEEAVEPDRSDRLTDAADLLNVR